MNGVIPLEIIRNILQGSNLYVYWLLTWIINVNAKFLLIHVVNMLLENSGLSLVTILKIFNFTCINICVPNLSEFIYNPLKEDLRLRY